MFDSLFSIVLSGRVREQEGSRKVSHQAEKQRPSFKPQLERLEERISPSGFGANGDHGRGHGWWGAW